MTVSGFMSRFLFHPRRGCWLWTGAIGSHGYGNLWMNGKYQTAHRTSYEAFIGPVPEGLFVLHKCDTKRCVNPDHLFLGTQADNIHDMDSKGRRVFGDLSGERNGMAKVSLAIVNAIRSEYRGRQNRMVKRTGPTTSELAAKFGLCNTQVVRIIHGESWK